MTFLIAARAFLGRIPWQAWACIAAIIALTAYGHTRYNAGRHSRDPEIAGLHDAVATEQANNGKLKAAVADQNDQIVSMRTAGVVAQKAVAQARQKAAQEHSRHMALKARLDAQARAGGAQCAVAAVNVEAWRELSE